MAIRGAPFFSYLESDLVLLGSSRCSLGTSCMLVEQRRQLETRGDLITVLFYYILLVLNILTISLLKDYAK